MKVIFSILTLFAITIFSYAQDEDLHLYGLDDNFKIPNGLNVGDEAPHILAHDMNGNLVDSKKILESNDIVLIFYRGVWCSYCDLYLSNMSDSLKYLKEHGAIVLAVAPESLENVSQTQENTEAEFVFLSDHNDEIMKSYDVLFHVNKAYQEKINKNKDVDIAMHNLQEEAKLPVPATYVIHMDGTIAWKHFDYDYSTRASVKEIMEHFDKR